MRGIHFYDTMMMHAAGLQGRLRRCQLLAIGKRSPIHAILFSCVCTDVHKAAIASGHGQLAPHLFEAVAAREADDEKDHKDEDQHNNHNDDLHLEILPPHLASQLLACLVEFVSLCMHSIPDQHR